MTISLDQIEQQANILVDAYPDEDLETLASDLEEDPGLQEGLEMAVAIAAELRLRAVAGVRKWPALKAI